ncbi:MAG: hypothetical protein HC855_10405 [Rhizobiales bacterium]|nr:hypothetical protein [Hyphomicrobiales bacterium]
MRDADHHGLFVRDIELADDFRRSALVADATVVGVEDASVEWRRLKGWVKSEFERKLSKSKTF